MTPRLDAIRDCLEGAVPGIVATCSPDGAPNVSYLSHAEYVDGRHVALSHHFFNATRYNVLRNPHARLIVTHPRTAERYRLLLHYLRTETAGPLFERMQAKLAGLASHAGRSDVLRLLGSDVYRVVDIERVPGPALASPAPPPSRLAALRTASARLATCREFDTLLTEALASLESQFGFRHTMVLMLDASGERLYTVASRGYEGSGVGAEVALGDGVIGIAAREATPIRVGYVAPEYASGRAAPPAAAERSGARVLETEIPLPRLPGSCSQLAVPIRAWGRVRGVLFAESAKNLRFGYDDEDALVALAGQLGAAMLTLEQVSELSHDSAAPAPCGRPPEGAPVVLRHRGEDDSVFVGDDYLIKGVAGAIFWVIVRDFVEAHRNTFSTCELRRDPRIPHADLGDDLEARLLLLRRRLNERDACVRLEQLGPGRLLLTARRPLKLVDSAPNPPRSTTACC